MVDPNRPFVDAFFKKFWNPKIPLKILAFEWQVILDRAPTRMNLWKRKIIEDIVEAKCVLCNRGLESIDHLIFSCNKTVKLWNLVYNWAGLVVVLPANGKLHFMQLMEGGMVLYCVVYLVVPKWHHF